MRLHQNCISQKVSYPKAKPRWYHPYTYYGLCHPYVFRSCSLSFIRLYTRAPQGTACVQNGFTYIYWNKELHTILRQIPYNHSTK